jgi:RHS repeat-associated protein
LGANSTQFSYNANHQRWKQVAVDAGATTTTYYIGGILEKVARPGGVTEYRHFIPTGSGTAIYTRRSNATNSTYYLTTDHLGSGDLVLDSAGGVLARESFGPFGERRGSNWQGTPSAGDKVVFGDVTRRGFTGHEMLDAVGLVNMNGRVYDPRIGRFLSADPVIQTLGLSQALNPYSYVMNSPLSLIDPSGFSWLSKAFHSIGNFLKNYWRPIVAIVAAVVSFGYLAPMASGWFFSSSYACLVPGAVTAAGATFAGAVSGALAGGIAGGWKGALAGAITGGLLASISATYGNSWTIGRVAKEGAIGGIGSEINGGSFADGFRLAAGFSLLRFSAFKMRQEMVRQSCTPGNPNCTGKSVGAFGDRTKIGGGRTTWPDKNWETTKPSLLGGNQGEVGKLLGSEYDVGSLRDCLIESYAGPHDWLSSFRYGYDASLVPYTGFGEAMFTTYSAIAVLPATPLAFATAVPTAAFLPATYGGSNGH